MKSVRAVFFDLDDTLVDGAPSREAIGRTCRKIADAVGVDAERLQHANSQAWASYWPQVEDDWTLGRLTGEALSLEAWRRTLAACGCDDESLARLARRTHADLGRGALRVFDDVHASLAFLRPRVWLGVITNGASDTQRGSLRVLGIEDQFDAVIVSGEVGAAKPDATVFRLALDAVGADADSTWHVGDSLTRDVAGARGAGLTAVWLNRDGRPRTASDPQPDHEVRSLRELGHLVGPLLHGSLTR